MSKELSEMTIEELWALFPIFLVEHREQWKADYREIESELQTLLSDHTPVRISHIGSTAVKDIRAKNIVDVLIEFPPAGDLSPAAEHLQQNGFIIMCMSEKRISLNKGYTKEGFADHVFHIHLRYAGDNDELYFRDYLNDHPDVAKAYESLKLTLWKRYEHNRDAYTDAKTDFIRQWTLEARKVYGDRY